MSRRYAYLVRGGVVVALLVVAVAVSLETCQRRDFTDDFRARKGALVVVEEEEVDRSPTRKTLAVTLRDDRGHRVDAIVQVPRSPDGPVTTLLLLGGLRTGRHTIDYIKDVENAVLMAIDYPYEGKKSGYGVIEFLAALPSIRRALMDTVPAGMLAVDYLLTRGDVDPDRIVVVGGSLGALFGPALAATDERVAGLALIFGEGDLSTLLAANLDMPTWLRGPVAWLGASITAPFEPLRYIGAVSPRPVFMLNGLKDPRMPLACSRKLHEAARDPKTVRFIDAGHVDIRSTEFHGLIRRELERWLHETHLLLDRPAPPDPDGAADGPG